MADPLGKAEPALTLTERPRLVNVEQPVVLHFIDGHHQHADLRALLGESKDQSFIGRDLAKGLTCIDPPCRLSPGTDKAIFVFKNIAPRIRQWFQIKISYVDTKHLNEGLALEAADAASPPHTQVQRRYRTELRWAGRPRADRRQAQAGGIRAQGQP